MRQRYTILVVAAVIASVIAPGVAMAAPVADAQVEQPDEATAENATVSGISTVFTLQEMTLESSEGDVMVEEAVVSVQNASMHLDNASFENNSLMADGGELMVENATVSVTSAEIETNDTTVKVENETFTIENRTLTMDNGSIEQVPAVQDSTTIGPVTVDREMARQVLQNATIDSMTIDGLSGTMMLDGAGVEEVTAVDRTANGHVMGVDAIVRNGSVTLENVRTENGSLAIDDGMVEVENGDVLVREAHLERGVRDRWTIMNEVFSIDGATFDFSAVELSPMDVLEMLPDASDQ